MNRNVVYLVEYSILTAVREKFYRSKIADVNELKHVWSMSERSLTSRSLMLISASSVVVLSVYPGHTSSIIANNIWIEVLFKLIILLNKPYFGLLCAD